MREIFRRRCAFFENRGERLFDLQKQMFPIGRYEKADGAESADAADAHDLEGQVHELIMLDEPPPFGQERAAVAGECGMGMNLTRL